MSATLGMVAIFTIFLFSDFVVSPLIFAPVPFVLVWLVSAYGFNNQKRWAWNLGMATALLSLLISPILLGPFGIIVFLPWIIVWPCSIIYLTMPHPKRFLGKIKGPETPAPDPSRPTIAGDTG